MLRGAASTGMWAEQLMCQQLGPHAHLPAQVRAAQPPCPYWLPLWSIQACMRNAGQPAHTSGRAC
eukprot:1501-Chlamydomonas_euryale.AAC.1